MSNPFEKDDARYTVLVNDQGQHSLWPEATAVPAGWQVVYGVADRQACLDYVEEHWTDMRPKRLADAVTSAA
ncbi:MbtH family protein [Streptomyces sp. NPDC048301]|uniref:MbtH family protein n=1 Tax=Streptomyces sp. NPDC048301 TaxID=3155631 RepID=UPI00342C0E7F